MSIGSRYTGTQPTSPKHSPFLRVHESSDVRPRKRRRPAHIADSVLTESVGSQEPLTTSEHFKTKLFFPVIDRFIVKMNERFDDSSNWVLKALPACSLSSGIFLSFQHNYKTILPDVWN